MSEISHAEVKPVKVGEPLTGNPEPSTAQEAEACVETRRRVCIQCGGPIPPGKYSNAKYCNKLCADRYLGYRWKVRKGIIKNPGVGSGGAQRGGANHRYKNGILNYSKVGFAHYGRVCNRCGSTRHLLVHHRNHDRTDNSIPNLEVLCKSCHQRHHETRDAFGRYTQRDSPTPPEREGTP